MSHCPNMAVVGTTTRHKNRIYFWTARKITGRFWCVRICDIFKWQNLRVANGPCMMCTCVCVCDTHMTHVPMHHVTFIKCVAACCSVSQHVASCCSVLQRDVSYTYESCHAHSTCCSVQCNVSRNESCHACKIKSHHAYKWRHKKKISWVTSYLELMLVRARNLPCNPAEYVTWLIHTCDVSHWCVRHYLLMR